MRTIVRGACPLDCPDTCTWLVDVEDGRAVGLRGDRANPFTHGALCPKVNRYLDALHDPDRVVHPLRRVGAKGEGRFERIGWDEAIEATAAGLRSAIERHGPESVLPYYFAGTEGMVQGWIMGPRLFAAMGASRLRTTICTAAAGAALKATYGGSVGMDPEDFEHANLVILWGANLLSTNLHQWRYVLAAQKRGAHVVAIDPLRTDTAARCDQHVAPRPGTDAALALGLMRTVLDEGAEDRDWLARHTEGWPELEARLAEWPVERAAEVCGLPVSEVRALGQRLAHTRPTAIRLGLGLQRHGGAGAAMRAVLALPALTGDFRHVGGGVLCMTGAHFGGINSGRVAIPADLPTPAARTINMSRLGEALTEFDDPPVAAMVVFDANPAASNPDHTRVHAGLAREDLFTVVLEQRMTDTVDFADIVLPATMQPEHLDIHDSYGQHYVTLNLPAVEPPGECLPNSEIFRRLARALGLDHPRLRESDEQIVRDVLDCDAARAAEITFERLRDEGALRVTVPGVARFASGGFPTASRPPAAARAGAGRAGRRSARGLRAAARARGRRARQALPAGTALPRLAPRAQLHLRVTALASRAARPAAGAPAPARRGRAGHRDRRAGARAQRPRIVPRRGRRRRRRAARRRLHVQAALAEAARPRPARQHHDPRARCRPGRQPDLPRQPGAGRARSHVIAASRVPLV